MSILENGDCLGSSVACPAFSVGAGEVLPFPRPHNGDLPLDKCSRDLAVLRRMQKARITNSRSKPANPPIAAPMIVPIADFGLGEAVAAVEGIVAEESVVGIEVAVWLVIEIVAEAEAELEDNAAAGRKPFAAPGSDDNHAAVTSPAGHPVPQASGHPAVQALTLQQPINGGLVSLHVYHELPGEQLWSLMSL